MKIVKKDQDLNDQNEVDLLRTIRHDNVIRYFEHLDESLHKDFDLTKILGHHSRFRRLIDDNKMTIDIPENWLESFPNEDRVVELFQHY